MNIKRLHIYLQRYIHPVRKTFKKILIMHDLYKDSFAFEKAINSHLSAHFYNRESEKCVGSQEQPAVVKVTASNFIGSIKLRLKSTRREINSREKHIVRVTDDSIHL